MMNIVIVDLLIIVFGYLVVISMNLNGKLVFIGSFFCNWFGFINGMIGMIFIVFLIVMSGVVY